MNRQILVGDVLEQIKQLPKDSIDLVCTDPPYGYSFMNKDWDKVVVSSDVWKECLRVLKPGSFAFVMSAPRQDVLCRVMINLEKAGFVMGFTSIYWAYASGFPKAMNVSKAVDKRNGRPQRDIELEKYLKKKIKENYQSHHLLAKEMNISEALIRHWIGNCGTQYLIPTLQQYTILKEKLNLDGRFDKLIEWKEAQREIIGKKDNKIHLENIGQAGYEEEWNETKSETPQAKKLDGSYAGFQPKPAVEVILVCMKPLEQKNYVEQALDNGKGVTWLDDCRIPYKNENDVTFGHHNKNLENNAKSWFANKADKRILQQDTSHGRFPANLLVSDNALDVGQKGRARGNKNPTNRGGGLYGHGIIDDESGGYGDEGDFSRYYSLDSWEAQFIITPKPAKSEKNKGLKQFEYLKVNDGRKTEIDNPYQRGETLRQNIHPTVKPVSLFKYLISLGSRPGDLILDPFMGTGTTAIACEKLARKWMGIEINQEYIDIAKKRLEPFMNEKLVPF